MIANFKFRTFLTFIKVNIHAWVYINRFHFVLWYILLYLLTASSNLSIYTFSDIEVSHAFMTFIRYGSNKSFSKFSFIISSIHFYVTILQKWFHWSILRFTEFIYPYFVSFAIRFFEIFLKSISNCNTFFIFQRNNSFVFTENTNNTQ